ncbi:hypothetical protein T492DRAFT_1068326 [Pavlovales sp. CCMP2436]|nr:hypothetical protein T492DRAFT_1068326 [Pavlovales sp. CCMP2436]
MKDWSKRETLAEKVGGMSDQGFQAVGLIGTIPVEFRQNEDVRTTMAIVGQPLSEVAAQAGQFVKYKCGKGECGTCEVRIDGQWVRTCTAKVPPMPSGDAFVVNVRASMVKPKGASRFFSFRSFLDGFRNNVLGMVGFVTEGRKSDKAFNERLENEKRIIEIAAAKRAAKKTADVQ